MAFNATEEEVLIFMKLALNPDYIYVHPTQNAFYVLNGEGEMLKFEPEVDCHDMDADALNRLLQLMLMSQI